MDTAHIGHNALGEPCSFQSVRCPLCRAPEGETIYERMQHGGEVLGKIRTELRICSQCALVYMSPRPSDGDMARYYACDPHASGGIFHEAGGKGRHSAAYVDRARFVGQMLSPHQRVLDIGCGQGGLCMALSDERLEAVGLEPAERARLVALQAGVTVIDGRIEDPSLKQRTGTFDGAAMMSVLEHLSDPLAALEAMRPLLKPQGLLFVEVPESTAPIVQLAEFYTYEHLIHFTAETLTYMLQAAGFELVRRDRIEGEPYRLRVAARKSDTRAQGPWEKGPSGRQRMLAAIERYCVQRCEFEQKSIERLGTLAQKWRDSGAKVAVYGAGVHSLYLMDMHDIFDVVFCFLDTNPRKQGSTFLGRYAVHGPGEIEQLAVDAILISSKAYQEEIYRSIAHHEQRGVEIVRWYSGGDTIEGGAADAPCEV